MHAFHLYLAKQLGEQLERRRVVVFYDPRREFAPFIDELGVVGEGRGRLPRVVLADTLAHLARYQGSFFGLRAALEPVAALDRPDALLVYVPGVARDRRTSVLMELEKGGDCYEPQLKRLARNVLRQVYTDGEIDRMLAPAGVTYADVARYLEQGTEGGPASVLRTIFSSASSEVLLARWLADETSDAAIAEQDATGELRVLVEGRLGLKLPDGTAVGEAREKAARYILVNQFRSDLTGEPPASVGLVPLVPSKEHLDRVREVTGALRRDHPTRYLALADRVEQDLRLAQVRLDAASLGSVDTFRFEERQLLRHVAELVAAQKYELALEAIAGRHGSFWLERDVSRLAQWEACRLMAELGRELERVRLALAKISGDPARWIAAYTADDGWFRSDRLQRGLETWIATMDAEPEAEQALSVVRREHEETLRRMADGFTTALREAGWTIPGVLPQMRVYPAVVQAMGRRVAYVLVDAMRYEMGVELAQQLQGAEELTIRPAVAALPTITPVGMAALLPGASASFSVVDHKGKLASRIEGTAMPGLAERLRFLKAKVPDVVEMTLGKVLQTPSTRLAKALEGAPLLVVRSQEVDFVGEVDSDLLARQVMDTIIGNIARAIRKLAGVGVEAFVVTADHGHQYSIRKDEDMRVDSPGGQTLDLHRRCWIGRGGATPPGTVRVSGAELGYDTDLDFVFPTGLGVFRAGGGLSFHHGGISLQELLVPVVSLRIPASTPRETTRRPVRLEGCPDRITNRTFGVRVRLSADLFATEPVALRVVLMAGTEQVGVAGMAVGAELDRATGIIRVQPGGEASVGLMLQRDDCQAARVVVQDPATDAILDQSDETPVRLGI